MRINTLKDSEGHYNDGGHISPTDRQTTLVDVNEIFLLNKGWVKSEEVT